MSFDPRPDVMIPRTVKGTINALVAARNQNTVRRFVLTSSSTAATNGNSNVPGIRVDERKIALYCYLKYDFIMVYESNSV